jgi:uncharacterized membrane protein (GlpM family)
MNYGRLAAAAVAATVVDACYGFLVYGMLLTSEFGRYPGVYRPNDAAGMAYLPLMFVGILIGMFAVVAIYAKGYEGGSGMMEGARFGALFGIFAVAFYVSVSYATLNIGRKLTAELAGAGLVEWIIAGIVIGLVYAPAATPARR